ncbi:MAG: transglutaminase-like domain-containing protein [Bacteroidota bacterium]|nr:transglutaminase-like domain-containing protein [Bacteroidota bacterium]
MGEENLNQGEINALISLLDDTDEEIVAHVTSRLLSFGDKVLPVLEDRYLVESETTLQARIHDIIDQIHQSGLHENLVTWAQNGGDDLFEGIYLVAKFRYPELNKQSINNQLDKIKLDAWLELNFQVSAFDKVRILNYILFDLYNFKGNTDDYHAPDNSYINRVLETRKGNPISLAIIYSIVAQRLNIPIFGVNLPQHFILAYKDETQLKKHNSFKAPPFMNYNLPGEILFYINAFNKGAVFSRWNIDQFLKQLNIKSQGMYFEPCSNVDIIMRVCRNLIFSYEKTEDHQRIAALKDLLTLLQPYGSLH